MSSLTVIDAKMVSNIVDRFRDSMMYAGLKP